MKTGRRDFIKQMGFVSIGFSLLGPQALMGRAPETDCEMNPFLENNINAWLQVLENGKVRILTGKMELGQGIKIAVAQVAAEELNMNPHLVEVSLAETGVTPNEGYTAGSRSIESSAMSIRKAAATAREILLEMAAKRLNTEASTLKLENGVISSDKRSLNFYELLEGQQLEETLMEPKEFYGKTRRRFVGKPIARKDIESMVRGELEYIQDLQFPNMVHARIIRSPSYTSTLTSLDEAGLEEMPGFLKLIKIGSFVGVVASGEYEAIQISRELNSRAKWKKGEELPSGTPLKEYLKKLPSDTQTDEDSGNWERSLKDAVVQHKALYFKPYIMHAANGPSCAVAYYNENNLKVYTHSQGVYPLRDTLANLLEMEQKSIHIKGIPGSGCYGHNGADDVAAEAALLAVEFPGKHIRLQWMRDEEHLWEPYGTAMLIEVQAGIDSGGNITGWKYDLWSDGHSTRPGGDPSSLLPARFLERGHGTPGTGFRGGAVRNSKPYYKIQNLNTTSHIFKGPLRKSALRGLGAYANIFAIESFMDELAEKAGLDPISFRLQHLEDPRARICVEKIKQNTANVIPASREGLGYAFARYKNSAAYFAVAALVKVEENENVRVKKMWGVIDAGETINPDGLKNQTEGGMIQAASWTLLEEVQFDAEHVTSRDWYSYPIYRFEEIPEVDVEVIDMVKEDPLGAGEAAQGPTAAAIANAVYNATGRRVRDLPINKV
tara:strand:+ start:146 stop:2311 length:2166 start_codon:yes stop_codon:yes gene_type:complete